MATTKYPGVYKNEDTGRYFYNIELGVDKITGKRIQKKASRTKSGKPFTTAKSAHEEATRIRNEYHNVNQYKNYKMTYGQFMKNIYAPYYKTSVENSTWESKKSALKIIYERFERKILREITVEDCELFRIYLMSECGYSDSYASLVYGAFRQSLDYCVLMEYIEENVSKKTKAIPKGKAVVPYWTKEEFEKVISVICIKNFYEHMCFVMLWLYYTTGARVSESLALTWNDVDFENKKLRIHGTLEWIGKGKERKYQIKPYTKTTSGQRTISLDDYTIFILKKWRERQLKHGVTKFIISYTSKPLVRKTVNMVVDRYSKVANVRKIQAKGLRHSNVSYLINEHNIDILVISQRLGHSSPEITLRHYAHLWSRNDSVVAKAITGNIKIETSNEQLIEYYGNQYVIK